MQRRVSHDLSLTKEVLYRSPSPTFFSSLLTLLDVGRTMKAFKVCGRTFLTMPLHPVDLSRQPDQQLAR
jgi:hypothetical protein